eukprot:1213099-Alexandrium_andersonii.AAC.1
MVLSTAPSPSRGGTALRTVPPAFGSAARREAVWPVGRAGTADPSGLDFEPQTHFDQAPK